jgi:hypothetical protein
MKTMIEAGVNVFLEDFAAITAFRAVYGSKFFDNG